MKNSNSFTTWGKGLGLVGTGIHQAYKYYTSTGESNQERLSRVPKKYQTLPKDYRPLSSQMVYYKNSKRSYKGRRTRAKSKRSKKIYYKKRIQKIKRQARSLETVKRVTAPSSIRHVVQALSVGSGSAVDTQKFGNGRLWGYDVGLCRFANGDFPGAYDDLAYCINQVTGITSSGTASDSNVKILIEKCQAKITVRNNTNVGVRLNIYYVSPRYSQSDATSAGTYLRARIVSEMDTSVTPIVTTKVQDQYMTPHTTLYEYSDVCGKFKLKKAKSFILYPAMTKEFLIKSPVVGKARSCTKLAEHFSSKFFHRSIIFQWTGLPVHSSDTLPFVEGPCSFGQTMLDFMIDHVVKFRKPEDDFGNVQNTREVTTTTVPIIAIDKQEIQPAVNPSNSILAS